MSVKGQRLHNFLKKPQVLSEFYVVIPGIVDSPVRCRAVGFPNDSRDEVALPVAGQKVFLPSKSQPSGEWTCELYESSSSDISYQLELNNLIQTLEVGTSPAAYTTYDVFIFLLNNGAPTFGKVLKGAWIKSVASVKLDASAANSPLVYSVNFRYQSCKRVI